MTTALNKHDIQKLEEYWVNYKDIKKMVQFREWELLNPSVEEEENVGSSRGLSISKPTESKALTLAQDRYYQNLTHIIKVVEQLYSEVDEDTQKIIDMRYWDDNNDCFEWEEIADKLFISRSKVLRKRNNLIDDTAKRIGWV